VQQRRTPRNRAIQLDPADPSYPNARDYLCRLPDYGDNLIERARGDGYRSKTARPHHPCGRDRSAYHHLSAMRETGIWPIL
jgi:hypothetical protein